MISYHYDVRQKTFHCNLTIFRATILHLFASLSDCFTSIYHGHAFINCVSLPELSKSLDVIIDAQISVWVDVVLSEIDYAQR